MLNYEKAKKLIYKNNDLSDCIEGITIELVEKVENLLEVKFPNTYKQYLCDFGALTFGATEIYGIVNDDFVNSGIPDVVWITLKNRKEFNLPKHLIQIYSLGDGTEFYLDTSKMNNDECPVISIHAPNFLDVESSQNEIQIEYDDFGEFFLELIQEEIEFQEELDD